MTEALLERTSLQKTYQTFRTVRWFKFEREAIKPCKKCQTTNLIDEAAPASTPHKSSRADVEMCTGVSVHTHPRTPASHHQLCTNMNREAGRSRNFLFSCVILKIIAFVAQLLLQEREALLLQEREALGPRVCLCVRAENAFFLWQGALSETESENKRER